MRRCQAMHEWFAAQAARGPLSPGQGLPCERELAERFAISRETVRKTIIQMSEYGLVARPDLKAKFGDGGKGIGIIVASKEEIEQAGLCETGTQLSRERYAAMLGALESKFSDAGFDVRHCLKGSFQTGTAADVMKKLKEKVVGLVALNCATPEIADIATVAAATGIGVAFTPMNFHSCPPLTSGVSWNNYQAGRIAAAHLTDIGHIRLGCIGLENCESWAHQREAGFSDCCRERNVHCEVIKVRINGPVQAPASAYAASELMGNGVSGVFAINDPLALNLHEELARRGVRIPADVSIVGCGNDFHCDTYGLSSLSLECMKTAEAAASALIDYLRQGSDSIWPVELKIPPRLIVRTSSAPPSGGRVTALVASSLRSRSSQPSDIHAGKAMLAEPANT